MIRVRQWKNSNGNVIHMLMPNSYFTELGLVDLKKNQSWIAVIQCDKCMIPMGKAQVEFLREQRRQAAHCHLATRFSVKTPLPTFVTPVSLICGRERMQDRLNLHLS